MEGATGAAVTVEAERRAAMEAAKPHQRRQPLAAEAPQAPQAPQAPRAPHAPHSSEQRAPPPHQRRTAHRSPGGRWVPPRTSGPTLRAARAAARAWRRLALAQGPTRSPPPAAPHRRSAARPHADLPLQPRPRLSSRADAAQARAHTLLAERPPHRTPPHGTPPHGTPPHGRPPHGSFARRLAARPRGWHSRLHRPAPTGRPPSCDGAARAPHAR